MSHSRMVESGGRPRRGLAALALTLALLLLAACGDGGGQEVSQADQVSRGQQVWADECQRCHMEGGEGPDLTAARLRAYNTAQGLYNYTSQAMPQDAPGSLTSDQYWDVTAHVLSTTGMLPADTVLGPGNASEVALTP